MIRIDAADVERRVPACPLENTQQIAWPVSEWTWMLPQLTADSSSGVLASSRMWMLDDAEIVDAAAYVVPGNGRAVGIGPMDIHRIR